VTCDESGLWRFDCEGTACDAGHSGVDATVDANDAPIEGAADAPDE
jgi:hypothetical protein